MRSSPNSPQTGTDRRTFLKWSAALGAGSAIGLAALSDQGKGLSLRPARAATPTGPVEIKHQACVWNCGGGSCVLKLEVQDGVITRVDTDQEDLPWAPAQRACQRGRSMRKHVYHPDRLKEPMKRVGKRGEGKFEPISWDDAYKMIADNLSRVIKTYGNQAVYYHYSSGIISTPTYTAWKGGPVLRLLNQLGGYLDFYGSYSSACYGFAIPYTLGSGSDNSADDMVNSRLVVLFAENPAETRQGGGGRYHWYLKAKEAGARFIVVDPRLSDTAKALEAEWIPIRPTTDNALINALAYVMIMENLHNQAFLDKYCIGFDEDHMPEGAPRNSSYRSYVLGVSDGIPKTPEWAEAITGVPRERIVALAREIATTKPCRLIQGLGWQRHAYGEQPVRGLPVLAAMTGNIGIPGGGTGTMPGGRGTPGPSFPRGTNGVKAVISCYHWPDVIQRGTEMRAKDGIRGVEKLDANIKFIWNYAGNTLINQHSDCGSTHHVLADEKGVEFILVHDLFMTPSAKYADLLLPDRSGPEREELGRSATIMGDRLYYCDQAIQPLYDTRDAFEICRGVAAKLGIEEKYTEGKTIAQWQEQMIETVRKNNPTFPTLAELKQRPIIKSRQTNSIVALTAFIADPVKGKLRTPSGKIEIYSERLDKMGKDWGIPEELPGLPKYIPAWEGPESPLISKYPIQCIGHHTKRRVHSTHDNNPWMEELEPQRVWINELDAAERGIKDGDMVKVWNDRGVIHLPAFVTRTIMPGVASIPQGAWYTPNKEGVDVRGNINTITKYHPTPGAKGNPQHTNLIQIAKL